jgi:3-deoxy-7-phosphoheptulonate synthase
MSITQINEVITPNELKLKYMPSEKNLQFISQCRADITNIIQGTDNRILVIVGPCSIHDYAAAIEYAKSLKTIQKSAENLYIVMRVYFEKPRSRTGWKGFIYDPDLDNSCNINKGLDLARKLLLEITQMEIPIGCEFLDLFTHQYVSDLVSWGAIGARTSESQTHRQLTSGLPMPVGFKNLTSGDYEKAINGIISAMYPHNFMSIDDQGRASQIITSGNKNSHLILRGGVEPNYNQDIIVEVTNSLKKEKINTGIIIDCSHGNSQSAYNRQILAALYVRRLRLLRKYPIRGIMIESNIHKGNQLLSANLKLGVSITDACIDISTTKTLFALLNATSVLELTTLAEVRKHIRDYDKIINTLIISPEKPPTLNNTCVLTKYMLEMDAAIPDITKGYKNEEELLMMISMRLALSEKVADIKFNATPFQYLYKKNDLLKLITDRDVEKEIVKRFNNHIYLKLMDISKQIQVLYLEKHIQNVRVGYLFGRGTFSNEVITANIRGIHCSYPTLNDLVTACETKTIDYILIPTYNSLIGEIFSMESFWQAQGTIDHTIELCLYSNQAIDKKKAERLYLEPHIQKECDQYIQTNISPTTEIITTASSLDGCIQCIKDTEHLSMTIASKYNNSNFLHVVDTDIVKHNITTFTLFSL